MTRKNDVERALGTAKQESSVRSLANILDRPIFGIDRMACAASAEAIKGYRASIETLPWGCLPRSNQLAFKLAFVAICHQFNWDFLQDRLARHLLTADLEEMIRRLSTIKANELEEWLAGYSKPNRIDAVRRAAILRGIGKQLSGRDGDVTLFLSGRQLRIQGPAGFIAQLDRFEPYRLDPLRKKSYVLVQDLVREGILSFEDEDSLLPAIDYHIMRIYLRSGRVVPLFEVVAEALQGKVHPRPRLVRLLREAVGEALQVTASYAKLSVAQTNYVEWQLGRSICQLDRPACLQNERPSELDPDVGKLFDGNCPYIEFCKAQSDPKWRKLREPNFISSFY